METTGSSRESLGRYYRRRQPARFTFSGRYIATSVVARRGVIGKTILVRDIELTSQIPHLPVAEHLWLRVSGEFTIPPDTKQGTKVMFSGIVIRYSKASGEIDYGIGDVEDIAIASTTHP